MNKLVSVKYLDDYNFNNVRSAVESGIELLNLKNVFKPKMKILLKVCLPNEVTQDSAKSTHPAVIRALVDYLTKLDISCVVADSPLEKYSDSYLNSVYFSTGMLEMANLTTCELNHDLSTCDIEIPEGVMTKKVKLLDVINKVDAIINVGKLKIDDTLGYLGATANLFGLIPGAKKDLILKRIDNIGNFNKYVIDIYSALNNKIVLNILDGIVALEAGKIQRMLNCLAISENSFSLDAVILDILKIKYDNTILKHAQTKDLFDYNKPYKVLGDKIDMFNVEDFKLVDFDNHTLLPYSHTYFKTHQQRPTINKDACKGCKICGKVCPTQAIIMRYDNDGELYAEIDYKKCIFCNKCITACPYSIIKQKTPLAYKTLMKNINKYNKDK